MGMFLPSLRINLKITQSLKIGSQAYQRYFYGVCKLWSQITTFSSPFWPPNKAVIRSVCCHFEKGFQLDSYETNFKLTGPTFRSV